MQTPEHLAKNLLRESKNPDSHELKILLHQLHEAVYAPGDISSLIGPVVMLTPCRNIQVKKAVYAVLPRLSNVHADAALLTVNTILHDCKDPNPAIRCVAISTLSSLPMLLREHVGPVLEMALNDGNPRIRRVAVASCKRVTRSSPGLLQELGLIDRLYEGIRDSDPIVVTTCLLVLDEALAVEGGVVVTRHMAAHLLNRLEDFPPAQLATMLQVLAKYRPSSEQELFRELSLLDPFLSHFSSSVVVNCIQLFLTLTAQSYSNLEPDIIKRTAPILQGFLQPVTPAEEANYVLDFLLTMKAKKKIDWLTAVSNTPHLFYPNEGGKAGDSKTSLKKLQLLPHLCTEENCSEVLQVLKDKHCNCPKIGRETIACICMILTCLPAPFRVQRLQVVEELLDSHNLYTFENTLLALQDLDLHQFEPTEVRTVVEKVLLKVEIVPGKPIPAVLPVVLGDFGELVPHISPYTLEALAHSFEEYKDEGMKGLILTAGLKLFVKMPAKCQHTLGEILEKCCNDGDGNTGPSLELQHRAWKYYYLLKHDVQLVKNILLAS